MGKPACTFRSLAMISLYMMATCVATGTMSPWFMDREYRSPLLKSISHLSYVFDRPVMGATGPSWRGMLLLLFSLTPVAYAITHVRRLVVVYFMVKRARAGLCMRCTYDLRAQSEVCPECGLVLPASKHQLEEELRALLSLKPLVRGLSVAVCIVLIGLIIGAIGELHEWLLR